MKCLKPERGKFFKDKKLKIIEFAPILKIKRYRKSVDTLMEIMHYPGSFLTDESRISDFISMYKNDSSKKAFLTRLSKKLGFDVAANDQIWEVAKKIRYSKK